MQKQTEIAWKHSSIQANVKDIFNTIANLLASNGKRFQYVEFILTYVGMRDIWIVPGIIAEGRICGVLYRRMYNQGVQSWRDGGNTSRS